MIHGLNRIIEGLDRIPALKDAQKSVREARADLNAAADVVEFLENPLSPDLLKALPDLSEARYKYYDSCADFLQKAVVQLDTFLIAQEL